MSIEHIRKIYTIDNKFYLVDIDNHCLYDVKFIEDECYGLRRFISCINGQNMYGCINNKFEEVIKCQYICMSMYSDYAYSVSFRNPKKIYHNDEKYFNFLINHKGIPINIISTKENGLNKQTIIEFEEYIAITNFRNNLAIGLSRNGKLGIVRSNGSTFIEAIYDYIRLNINEFHIYAEIEGEGVIVIYLPEKKTWVRMTKEYKFENYDIGERIFILKYNDKCTAIDFSGRNIIQPIYQKLQFKGNYILAKNENNKTGVILKDNPQSIIVPFEYTDIIPLDKEFFYIRNDEYIGLYSINEKKIIIPTILPVNMQLFPQYLGEGVIGYKLNSEKGFINFDGEKQFTFNGNFKTGFNNNFAYIIQYNKCVKIDKLGNKLEETEIIIDKNEEDDICWTEEDSWDVMTDGAFGKYPGGDIDYEKFGF